MQQDQRKKVGSFPEIPSIFACVNSAPVELIDAAQLLLCLAFIIIIISRQCFALFGVSVRSSLRFPFLFGTVSCFCSGHHSHRFDVPPPYHYSHFSAVSIRMFEFIFIPTRVGIFWQYFR